MSNCLLIELMWGMQYLLCKLCSWPDCGLLRAFRSEADIINGNVSWMIFIHNLWFSKLNDCFFLPCPGIPTVASIMIWTSDSMPSSSTYVSAPWSFKIYFLDRPWASSMHWCPCQAEPHVPGAAAEDIRQHPLQTQSGCPHPVRAYEQIVATGNPWWQN